MKCLVLLTYVNKKDNKYKTKEKESKNPKKAIKKLLKKINNNDTIVEIKILYKVRKEDIEI